MMQLFHLYINRFILLLILLLFLLLWKFFMQALAHGFWMDSEYQQFSPSLWDYSTYFGRSKNAVTWMVSLCPLISWSSSSFTGLLGIVPRAPFIIGIIVILDFFSFRAWSSYLFRFSLSFNFTEVYQDGKVPAGILYRSLSDMFPQVTRKLQNILADFCRVISWIVLILPQISRSSSLFSSFFKPFPEQPQQQ